MYGDNLVALYDSTVSAGSTRPASACMCHYLSSVSVSSECRKAKRALRSQERVLRRAGLLSDITTLLPATTAWRDQRRSCFVRSHSASGLLVLTLNSHSRVVCGGHSTSCLGVVQFHTRQTSMPPSCITISTTSRGCGLKLKAI